MDRPTVTLDVQGVEYDMMCHMVFDAIRQRNRERYKPPFYVTDTPSSPTDGAVPMPTVLPEITSIKMGYKAYHNAIKFSYVNSMTMVNYDDGKGARPSFWRRVCDLDLDMPPYEIQLS